MGGYFKQPDTKIEDWKSTKTRKGNGSKFVPSWINQMAPTFDEKLIKTKDSPRLINIPPKSTAPIIIAEEYYLLIKNTHATQYHSSIKDLM